MSPADRALSTALLTRVLTRRPTTRTRRTLLLVLILGALSAPLWSPAVAIGAMVATVALLLLIVRVASHQLQTRELTLARVIREREQDAHAAEQERLELSRQTEDRMSRDPLTGLLNRATFTARVAEAVARARAERRSCTVLVLDIARFASFNERYGAVAADELLLAVAARVSGALRPEDTVSRINGDVFAALLETVPAELVRDVAQRLLASTTASYAVGPALHTLDIACGLVNVAPDDEADALDVIYRAEVALQNAKATRTPVVVFEPRLEWETKERLKFHEDLARACRDGELHLVYQPLFDSRTGRVQSVEALMRWTHPERGLIPPSDFIPVAENSGHIIEMGLWALAAACRQQRVWRARYEVEIDVAVNFSARQLAEPDVVDRVREVVTREAADPRRVKLEITESLLVEDMERAVDVLTRLRALGLRLSVDDFGTGYSSLSRLGELPIDELKIDRYFVEGIGCKGPRETILTAAIAMGHGLGLTVVAEGVETAEQLNYLRAHNCDYIQGFLVGRPVDAPKALELVRGPGNELFGVPLQRTAPDESEQAVVPAVLPSVQREMPRRLFAR